MNFIVLALIFTQCILISTRIKKKKKKSKNVKYNNNARHIIDLYLFNLQLADMS
jgi:hypothetical protein